MKTYYLFSAESNVNFEIDLRRWSMLTLEFGGTFFSLQFLCFEVTWWLRDMKTEKIKEQEETY